jgi:transglutaminase-like putative cysteine protease
MAAISWDGMLPRLSPSRRISPERGRSSPLIARNGRYIETDRLSQIAWDLFGQSAPGWARVQAICDFVNRHITFGYENARSTRTAFEAYEERVGVCRDFTHLAVAFRRCMNIPACYANGYLGDIGVPPDPAPMDFNAWFEASR